MEVFGGLLFLVMIVLGVSIPILLLFALLKYLRSRR